jgi:signal transduction histidine kinase/CheY-like chemotaxis protein
MNSRRFQLLVFIALFALYFITARFGLSLNAANKFATLVWPPTGISLAALLLFDGPLWPAIFLAAFLVNLQVGAPFAVALAMGAGNTLEAVLGAWLIRRNHTFHPNLDRLQDVFRLIFYGAVVSTLVSATIGNMALLAGGVITTTQFPHMWMQWWVGDAAADLTFTPLLVVFGQYLLLGERSALKPESWLEFLTIILTMIFASGLVLSGVFGEGAGGYAKEYFLFPFLLWATMRFAQLGSVLVVFTITMIALWSTAFGYGPFTAPSPETSLMHLIVFTMVIAATGLILGAVVSQRQKETERAEAANAAKSEFLANMSHEIRTPLGAVLGFSELLGSEAINPAEKKTALDVIKRNGRMLAHLVDDILDLSKVEAGKLSVEFTSTPISDLIAELTSELARDASAKGLKFSVNRGPGLPENIHTDALRLRQILLNVAGNAIKFTRYGLVTLDIHLAGELGKRRLAFVVTDTGPGILGEERTRLFEPFHQLDASITRRYGGTGLGLALSKRLAKALGGDLVLDEERTGPGTSFILTIDAGEIPEARGESESGITADRTKARPLTGREVLIVDDNKDNLLLAKTILQLEGARVDTAESGIDAIVKTANKEYSLVLMDLQMPDVDGFMAVKKMRDSGYRRPIVALTAHALIEERNRCLQSGFNEHLSKPIDKGRLLDVIKRFA